MNRYQDFLKYRKEYPDFIYRDYSYNVEDKQIKVIYNFEIPGLIDFYPEIWFPKEIVKIKYQQEYFDEFIFQIGLIELISYVKATCSPNIIIEAGYIDDIQISFFKKLYYKGLGEFLYTNGIDISEDELFNIKCNCEKRELPKNDYVGHGNLICVGGGKDSCVSLELLKNEDNACFVMNPKKVTLSCCMAAGYGKDKIVVADRTLDKGIIDLNKRGFLNGHTPLSSLIAFISYFCCYLNGREKVILSNEASANQATVLNSDINHQYSKTFEFETDFRGYISYTFSLKINYFSLLRGLSEYNIAKLFSHYKKYHKIFKSCNLGSKNEEWVWCCNCPKCLFIYIILSPFLSKEERVEIFGEDLYNREDLLDTFIELLGYSETKPFECVGTYEEAKLAVSQAIKNNETGYLLDYYKNHYDLYLDQSINNYNEENYLGEYNTLVKKELELYD